MLKSGFAVRNSAGQYGAFETKGPQGEWNVAKTVWLEDPADGTLFIGQADADRAARIVGGKVVAVRIEATDRNHRRAVRRRG